MWKYFTVEVGQIVPDADFWSQCTYSYERYI